MSKIYDFPLYFNLVRRFVIFMFKRFYGDLIVIGKENIPTDCPVIFAPNHTNALMDAIAVHAVIPRNLPLIFLARADIFKSKGVAKLLNYAKILPAFRMRDGIENLGKNNQVFEQCIEILENKKALGIMPEGNQEIERNIRPIVKGIFRIAFAAQQKFGEAQKVKIVPVGLDFGDIIKANKHIIINIGKPIEVSEYMDLYIENPVAGTNKLRDKLRDDLQNLTVNLDTNEYYRCFEIAVEIPQKYQLDRMSLPDTKINRFYARQKTALLLIEIEKNNLPKMKKIDLLCTELDRRINQLNLKYRLLEKPSENIFQVLKEAFELILLLPLIAAGFLLNFLPFLTPVYIRKNILKAEFIGFFGSLQFGLAIITFPVFYIFQTMLFALIVSNVWWAILLFFFAQYPLGKVSLYGYKKMIKLIAKIRYRKFEKSNSIELAKAQIIRSQIISLISNS